MIEIFRQRPITEETKPQIPSKLDELIDHTRRFGRGYSRQRIVTTTDGHTYTFSTNLERTILAKHLRWLRSPQAQATDFQTVLERHHNIEFTLQILRVS